MREEARASPRLKTLEIGILLGRYCGNYLQEIEASSDLEMVRALTKYDLDWDYIDYLSSEAGWQFQALDYDEPSREDAEEESEEAMRYELQFKPLPQLDKELQEVMNKIMAQRILINILFAERFSFELFKEAEPDSRITCIPWEGFNDWNAPLCVAALANYLIETMDGAKVKEGLIRMLQTMSSTLATRTDLDQLKSIELLRTFLESHNYPGHKYGGVIRKLKDIQSLRSLIKPIHFTDKGFRNFIRRYRLEDMLDPENKQGDFYALVHKVLEVALEALDELYQILIEKDTT